MDRAGLILAGGKSSRMGVNKALIKLGGRAIITRVAETLLQVSSRLIVAVARDANPDEYRRLLPKEALIVVDKLDSDTPLVGIISGLQELPLCHCAIVSCDLPFVSSKVLDKLFQEAEGYDAAIPRWPDGRIEPLQAIYSSKETEAAAKKAYAEKEWANRDMIKRLGRVRMIPIEDLKALDPDLLTFFNMNSPADVKKAKLIAKKTSRR